MLNPPVLPINPPSAPKDGVIKPLNPPTIDAPSAVIQLFDPPPIRAAILVIVLEPYPAPGENPPPPTIDDP